MQARHGVAGGVGVGVHHHHRRTIGVVNVESVVDNIAIGSWWRIPGDEHR